jgi:hypothetical protein
VVGQRRVPGIKLHDDRVIRLLEILLHPGSFVADWTTRDAHARLLARHRLSEPDYRLGQLGYDLAKLRAKGLVERLGRTPVTVSRRSVSSSACCSPSCGSDYSDLSAPWSPTHSARSTPPLTISAIGSAWFRSVNIFGVRRGR